MLVGNWHLHSWKRNKPSCVISSISVMVSGKSSIKNSEFQHSCVYRVMIKHVSCITKTLWLFKVRKHISGSPTLSKSLCGRSPVAVIELSYSIGKRTEIVLLSRCMDWVNAFKTWSAPAIILIACLSEVMKVLTFPFVFLAPLYKYLPSIRTSSTISWITWSFGSHVHSIRVILTAKVLAHQIWYRKPLFVLNGNGTDHMSNVMREVLVQARRKQRWCSGETYMLFWRRKFFIPIIIIADSSAVDGLRLALLDGGVTLGW